MGAKLSKVSYRENVVALLNGEVPDSQDGGDGYEVEEAPELGTAAWWNRFWVLPESADDVFALLPPKDIRALKKQAPGNLVVLLRRVGVVSTTFLLCQTRCSLPRCRLLQYC